MYVDT